MGSGYSNLPRDGYYENAVVKPLNKTYKNSEKKFSQTGLRAVIIGINYSKTEYPLSGCVNDANNFLEFTKTRKYGNRAQILVLNDEDPLLPKPTKDNILKSIAWLNSNEPVSAFTQNQTFESKVQSGCTLVFYYAGHGSQVKDNNGDEEDGYDETLCPVTEEGGFDDLITDDDIAKIIINNSSEDNCFIFITDCCHSGSNCDLKYKLVGKSFLENNKYQETKGNVLHMSGCFDYQTAKEGYIKSEKESRGYFTHSLIQAFTNCRLSVLTFNQRCNNVMARLVNNSSQLPQISSGRYITSSFQIPY